MKSLVNSQHRLAGAVCTAEPASAGQPVRPAAPQQPGWELGEDRNGGDDAVRLGVLLQLDVPIAVAADDFMAEILQSRADFFFTMRARHIGRVDFHRTIVEEGDLAVLAGDLQATIFAVNPQFLFAAGTGHVMPSGRCGSNHSDLRQWKVGGYLDAVFREF